MFARANATSHSRRTSAKYSRAHATARARARKQLSLSRSAPLTGRRREAGQTLVEFALIFPLFIVLVMGVIEFALAFNAILGVNRASEQAVQVASEAGNDPASDCYVLQQVEDAIQTPNEEANIVHVQIQWTNPSGGTVYAMDEYDRSGSTTCAGNGGTSITVPYTATASAYPPSQRCNVITGCPTISSSHNTVDTIGVTVRYQYSWKTPIGSVMRLIGGNNSWGTGMTFNKRNVMRIEPVL